MEFPSGSKRIYPTIVIARNEHPFRWYAFPILGGLIKGLIIFPIAFVLPILYIFWQLTLIINVFVVLFTGRYWRFSFEIGERYIKFSLKATLFMLGVTDNYPGLKNNLPDNFSLTIPYPVSPNRLFAFPLLGFLFRSFFLIPFFVFYIIVAYGYYFLYILSSIPVFFKGYFPESTHELIVDGVRIGIAISLYLAGISDTYPSFKISMNHKVIKIIALAVGTLYLVSVILNNNTTNKHPGPTPPIEKPYSS